MQILLNRLLVQDEQVLHTCDNPPCVNPNHLFIGTNQDNMNDMFAKGRNAKGEKHGCAKLTEADVQKIRTLHKEWWSVKYLSKKFNVTRSTIYLIIHRKIWTHI